MNVGIHYINAANDSDSGIGSSCHSPETDVDLLPIPFKREFIRMRYEISI